MRACASGLGERTVECTTVVELQRTVPEPMPPAGAQWTHGPQPQPQQEPGPGGSGSGLAQPPPPEVPAQALPFGALTAEDWQRRLTLAQTEYHQLRIKLEVGLASVP